MTELSAEVEIERVSVDFPSLRLCGSAEVPCRFPARWQAQKRQRTAALHDAIAMNRAKPEAHPRGTPTPTDSTQPTREGSFGEGHQPFARSWTAAVLCRFAPRWQVEKRQRTAALPRRYRDELGEGLSPHKVPPSATNRAKPHSLRITFTPLCVSAPLREDFVTSPHPRFPVSDIAKDSWLLNP